MMNSPTDALTHGVYLVGTNVNCVQNLMTAAWVTQISSKALLVAVGRSHYTAELIRQSGHFSLSVLSQEQREIARSCGTVSGRKANKLEGLCVTPSADGDPLLAGAVAHFACRVIHTAEVLDHVLFCAEIADAQLLEGTPLSYHAKEFF